MGHILGLNVKEKYFMALVKDSKEDFIQEGGSMQWGFVVGNRGEAQLQYN